MHGTVGVAPAGGEVLIAWTSDLIGTNLLDSYQLVSQMGLAPAATSAITTTPG
jgi:hypothetical protein